jgi:hypothetical protein
LNRLPDSPSFAVLNDAIVEPARMGALYGVASGLLGSAEHVEKLLTDTYLRYLGRTPTTPELTGLRDFIRNGSASLRQVVVALVASQEYVDNSGGTNETWLDRAYVDLFNIPDVTDSPGGQELLNALDTNALSRGQLATLLVFNDLALQRVVTEYFVKFLGRTPVRNADPALDETTPFVSFLKFAPAPGQQSGDQIAILGLVAGKEYLRTHGNGSAEWLKSVYTTALGRAAAPTVGAVTAAAWANTGGGQVTVTASNNLLPGDRVTVAGVTSAVPGGYNGTFTVLTASPTGFTYALATNPGTATVAGAKASDGRLDDLLAGYLPAREQVLTALTKSREFRDLTYTGYYTRYLSVGSAIRLPTAAELANAEQIYQGFGKRLELAVAYIMSTGEYSPLAGPTASNSGWLSKVYSDLLGRGTANDPVAAQQLQYLNSNSQSAAALSNARLIKAYEILNSTEYRKILVAGIYSKYLGRAATTAEVDFWVARMNNPSIADTQETIIILLTRGAEYYRFRAL